ncbi:MAG: hypothetical protein KC423_29220 [Anaerolineales bacterium]|nr:hypothetical protein [Anaerolineales bacterium]
MGRIYTDFFNGRFPPNFPDRTRTNTDKRGQKFVLIGVHLWLENGRFRRRMTDNNCYLMAN